MSIVLDAIGDGKWHAVMLKACRGVGLAVEVLKLPPDMP
jgi:hypothetical protein